MTGIRLTVLSAILALGVGGLAGCVADDEDIMCSNFDDFLYVCYYNCAADFECKDSYAQMDAVQQQLMLDCSECLQQKSLENDCSDCIREGWSCEKLMAPLFAKPCDM